MGWRIRATPVTAAAPAADDAPLPAGKSWRDRAQSVDTSATHTMSANPLNWNAEEVDKFKGMASDAWDKSAANPSNWYKATTHVAENIPVLSPLVAKAGRVALSGLAGSTPGYSVPELEAADKAKEAKFAAENPGSDFASKALGGAMLPVPGRPFKAAAGAGLIPRAVTGVGNAAARVGTGTAISAADAAARGDDAEKAGSNALITGTALESAGALGMGAATLSKPVADYLKDIAQKRAFKAATGQNIGAIRKAARSAPKGAIDLDKAEANIKNIGSDLLEKNDAGPAVIGFGNKVEDIGPAAAAKQDFYGKKIGEVGSVIDSARPDGSIDGADIARKIRGYADSIPGVGKAAAIKERLAQEAETFEQMGMMTFAQAQKAKNQFGYVPQAADALVSNQDASNELGKIISKSMDRTVERASQGLSPELLQRYGEYKGKYGSYKQASEAATDRALKNLSNRAASPSDYAAGATSALAAGIHGGSGVMSAAAAAAGAIANKVARERGNSFVSRSANGISDILSSSADAFSKWLPALQDSAMRGNEYLTLRHHMLMKSDPDYKSAYEQAQGGNP